MDLHQLLNEDGRQFTAGLLNFAQVRELAFWEGGISDQCLVHGWDSRKASAILGLHEIQNHLRIDKAVTQNKRATRTQMSVQQGRAKTIMKRQDYHDTITIREIQAGDDRVRIGFDVLVSHSHNSRTGCGSRGKHQSSVLLFGLRTG